MQYVNLGATGLKVSRLCLGTMTYGTSKWRPWILDEDESRPLLDFLMEHGHRPEFTCRFRWTTGAVAFWDNRCVKHLAINDAGPYRRVMRRVQIA